MTAHLEMKPLSTATTLHLDRASRAVAATFMRLLTESCATQARAAVQAAGPEATVGAASEHLGQRAMTELMSNAQVGAAIGAFATHLDTRRLEAVLQPR